MSQNRSAFAVTCLLAFACSTTHADDLRTEATAGLKKAVTFFHEHVARQGGYVWNYSADLKLREGEGKASSTTIWIQPPGTPAVGMAILKAYERTGDTYYLNVARDAGTALVQAQLHSGGWNDGVYFDPETRKKYAYRVDGPASKKAKNISTFDDNRSQSAVRFLARLDKAEAFKNETIHRVVLGALDAILSAQHANGAWSQVWDGPVAQDAAKDLHASFPADWPREYPGGDYWWHYTLNDNDMADTIEALLECAAIYNDDRYRAAAIRGGQFLIRAQLPEPQPAWAQQYDKQMHPAWARKFEPPAVSGSESQRVMLTLCRLYRETGDEQFLKPIPPAIAWMRRSLLPDGQLARFYELQTNKPLYFTADYKLVYKDNDLPTHYGFKVKADLEKLEAAYLVAKLGGRAKRDAPGDVLQPPSDAKVREVLAAMDERGAWVERGTLKYHKVDGLIISCETFIKNVEQLSRFVSRP